MEPQRSTFLVSDGGRHIVGNEMLDDEVTASMGRY